MSRPIACVVLFSIFTAQGVFSADWPQWRGPDRDGKAAEPGLELDWTKAPPKHQWTIDGMGRGYASLAIVDGRLYTTGNLQDGQAVVCVDLKSQERVWSKTITNGPPQHGYEGSRCTPTIDGDRCYVTTSDGEIACLKTADGEIVWVKKFEEFGDKQVPIWGFSESPLVDGDLVLCTPGNKNAMIVAFNKVTGAVVWKTSAADIDLGSNGSDGAGYSSIVISHGAGVKQYVQLVGRGVIGVRASDGKLLWNYNRVANGTANIPTPICYDDYVFASTGYGAGAVLLKLSKQRAGVKATEEYFLEGNTFQNHHGGMIRDGEYVYAGHRHGQGDPTCLHLPTGEIVWKGRTRNQEPSVSGSAAITYVNGKILFRYQNGTIALINASPDGYEVQGGFVPEYQEGESWSHPVVVDGKLYLREQDKLMCYEL